MLILRDTSVPGARVQTVPESDARPEHGPPRRRDRHARTRPEVPPGAGPPWSRPRNAPKCATRTSSPRRSAAEMHPNTASTAARASRRVNPASDATCTVMSFFLIPISPAAGPRPAALPDGQTLTIPGRRNPPRPCASSEERCRRAVDVARLCEFWLITPRTPRWIASGHDHEPSGRLSLSARPRRPGINLVGFLLASDFDQ